MRYTVIFTILLLSLLTKSGYAAESLRISPSELSKQLNTEAIIIDVRSKNDYALDHIKGALNFPVEHTYANKKVDGKIAQPSKIQKKLRELGINLQSKIIIYDGGQLVDAARVFWTFEVYGLNNVKILDHGYNHWIKNDLPIEHKIKNVQSSNYVVTINNQRLSSKFTTQIATKNANKIIIDARSLNAYRGKTSVAKRFGHIPTALNVPFSHHVFKENGFSALKPIKELKKIYADIPQGKKIIIYCKIGRVSSTNYFALRELGHDVSNYDASWREWGNDYSLPIEK